MAALLQLCAAVSGRLAGCCGQDLSTQAQEAWEVAGLDAARGLPHCLQMVEYFGFTPGGELVHHHRVSPSAAVGCA